ncbi:hypothetical protein [Microcoleus sp. Pol12B5]|uniref:hypothetical protein n=1 Tax=Microcoleus sp. Pol12B5 TaxID=3055396 RepID=UPI002FCE85AC
MLETTIVLTNPQIYNNLKEASSSARNRVFCLASDIGNTSFQKSCNSWQMLETTIVLTNSQF